MFDRIRLVIEEFRPDLLEEFDALQLLPIAEVGNFLNEHFPRGGGWSGEWIVAVPYLLHDQLATEALMRETEVMPFSEVRKRMTEIADRYGGFSEEQGYQS